MTGVASNIGLGLLRDTVSTTFIDNSTGPSSSPYARSVVTVPFTVSVPMGHNFEVRLVTVSGRGGPALVPVLTHRGRWYSTALMFPWRASEVNATPTAFGPRT